MITIQIYRGDRSDLLPLFREADESESEIQSYHLLGDVLVARDDRCIVGLALVERSGGTVQIISLAVLPKWQGQGIGSRLIEQASVYGRDNGAERLMVCTGAWETENIAYYKRRGFHVFHVEQGFFTPEKGYAAIGDQVQFERLV